MFFAVMPAAAQRNSCFIRGLGTPARVIPRLQLESTPGRTALEMLEQYVPATFQVMGSALALQTREATAGGADVVEPLLLLDGVAMVGSIAQVMDGLKAGDLAGIEVHLGTAAWRFRPGGAPAVIEVTTLAGERLARERTSQACTKGGPPF